LTLDKKQIPSDIFQVSQIGSQVLEYRAKCNIFVVEK